jgi:hypothetical protein
MIIEKYNMERLDIKDLEIKYSNIEDKIPFVWKTYEEAGIELAQDLSYGHWDVSSGELYRVISLVSLRVRDLKITHHLDPQFAFMGLYPERMKRFDIDPDVNPVLIKEMVRIYEERKKRKQQ